MCAPHRARESEDGKGDGQLPAATTIARLCARAQGSRQRVKGCTTHQGQSRGAHWLAGPIHCSSGPRCKSCASGPRPSHPGHRWRCSGLWKVQSVEPARARGPSVLARGRPPPDRLARPALPTSSLSTGAQQVSAVGAACDVTLCCQGWSHCSRFRTGLVTTGWCHQCPEQPLHFERRTRVTSRRCPG